MSFISELKPIASEFNLLYVEDEEITRERFSFYFIKIFKNVYTAENGDEGLTRFEENNIDIIITDVNMPIMNGLDFSRIIKDAHPTVPIILMTANTGTDCFIQAIDIGIDKFLMKPIVLDKLSFALKEMLHTLKTYKENIRLEELSHTLTDELETKTKELNLFKDDMIAIFTHELKTPLHAIINFSEYIHKNIQKELTPKRIQRIGDLAHKIHANGLAQSSLIESLLDVSKYKAGKMVLNEIQIDPKEIIETIIHRYQSLYEKEVTSQLEKLDIIWDKKAFMMIFENLFSNALKHSHSKIHITYKKTVNNHFFLSIEDDGDGIEEEMRGKIFGQFEQLDEAVLDRKKSGTGLGLYMVKLILDTCHSKVEVGESAQLGGASFNIEGRIHND